MHVNYSIWGWVEASNNDPAQGLHTLKSDSVVQNTQWKQTDGRSRTIAIPVASLLRWSVAGSLEAHRSLSAFFLRIVSRRLFPVDSPLSLFIAFVPFWFRFFKISLSVFVIFRYGSLRAIKLAICQPPGHSVQQKILRSDCQIDRKYFIILENAITTRL